MEEKNYIILNKKVRVNYKSIFMCMTRLKYLNMLGTCKFGQCWTCGVHSVDTKSEIVKILHFKQFYKHYVFVEDGEGGRKKLLKNYIDVNVCIDMVCGDTKNVFESEDE